MFQVILNQVHQRNKRIESGQGFSTPLIHHGSVKVVLDLWSKSSWRNTLFVSFVPTEVTQLPQAGPFWPENFIFTSNIYFGKQMWTAWPLWNLFQSIHDDSSQYTTTYCQDSPFSVNHFCHDNYHTHLPLKLAWRLPTWWFAFWSERQVCWIMMNSMVE